MERGHPFAHSDRKFSAVLRELIGPELDFDALGGEHAVNREGEVDARVVRLHSSLCAIGDVGERTGASYRPFDFLGIFLYMDASSSVATLARLQRLEAMRISRLDCELRGDLMVLLGASNSCKCAVR